MVYFKDKKIAVLGLGVEGEDVCRFLTANKAGEITVFDQKEEKELGEIVGKLRALGISFQTGPSYLSNGLKGFDYLFRSPGFKSTLPSIVEAEKHGVVVLSATKLFFDLFPGKIIGVTGTKGKGTTATLIYQILESEGKEVFLAGNIGTPMLSLLSQSSQNSLAILELSSFQLIDLKKSPHLAVVLNITVDHLDWHENREKYVLAKENIVRFQGRDDLAVLNFDYETSRGFAQKTKAQVYYFSRKEKVLGCYVQEGKIILNLKKEEEICQTQDLKLRGEHNWENITAAILASSLVGAFSEKIRETVVSFKGLEHRLEFIKEKDGVKYYDDSFSTTPETCLAAIASFDEPIILIAGGSEKGSDFSELGKDIVSSTVKTLILIGKMANRIKESVQKSRF